MDKEQIKTILQTTKGLKTIHESASMKALRETAMSISALQESASMKALREAAMSVGALHESASMKALRETAMSISALQESASMKALREAAMSVGALHESASMKALREIALSISALQESASMKMLREAVMSVGYAQTKRIEALMSLDLHKDYHVFSSILNLKNSPLNDFILSNTNQFASLFDDAVYEIDQEIIEEVSSVDDFNLLSEKTKKNISYIYHIYIIPFLITYFFYMLAETNAIEARKELNSISSYTEVKKFVSSPNNNLDKSLLKGYRVTTGHGLSFRESPNIKSSVMTYLPIGTLIKVLDKSNRSWLYVEVEVEGSIQHGWVSRQYTTYFK